MQTSLSIRLLLIFVLGFILLISLLNVSFGYSLKREATQLQAQSVLGMTRIILERRTQNVNFNRAERVAQRTGINIHIQTSSRNWSSEDTEFNEQAYQFSPLSLKHFLANRKFLRNSKPPTIEIADKFNSSLYKITTPQATLFFEMEKSNNIFGWHLLVITAILLTLLYMAIRYQFSPVTEIKRVVHEISQGNFKARIKTQRKDDIGQLAAQVNDMAEDIDRSMESKRSLLLGISHELRTPLTRAKISAEMLKDDKNKDSLVHDITEMESIITELIEAEKLSSGKALTRQVTDINALISEVINDFFTAESVEFTPLNDSPYVNIDPIRLKLLVKNLLKNALQYSAKGSSKPEISLDIDEQKLTINIIDHGIGMPEDVLDKLTEPFYRLDQARQRKTGGFGLGLYLCQAIANAHDGKLNVNSQLGKGTHIRVELSLISSKSTNK